MRDRKGMAFRVASLLVFPLRHQAGRYVPSYGLLYANMSSIYANPGTMLKWLPKSLQLSRPRVDGILKRDPRRRETLARMFQLRRASLYLHRLRLRRAPVNWRKNEPEVNEISTRRRDQSAISCYIHRLIHTARRAGLEKDFEFNTEKGR